MPGLNCVFPECGVTRREKYDGIGIFQVPKRKDAFHQNWKKDLQNIISKYRTLDKDIKKRFEDGKVYICERHFRPEDVEFTGRLRAN